MGAPIISYVYKLMFEGRLGQLYFDISDHSLMWGFVWAPLLWAVIADATFYWSHRTCHEIPFLYAWSHKNHHAARPSTSFAGNAADVFDLTFTGYSNTVMGAILIPMHAKMFLVLSVFNQLWAVGLHCFERWQLGYYINDAHLHGVHHHYGRTNYNFGLYFQFWDRVMGTYKANVTKGGKVVEMYSTPKED
mmetsp:Transcript_8397/g.12585  ORF Transcript_8397/g.12585 Transcript_8397/m.12585 type:complete len:191 (-) Transcript_8397:223-795(-)